MDAVAMLESLAGRLLEASVVGGALVLMVWIACRLLPGLPPVLRCWLWWGVTLKMLLGLVPLPPLGIPLLPSAGGAPAMVGASPPAASDGASDGDRAPATPLDSARRADSRHSAPASIGTGGSLRWSVVLCTLWAGVVILGLARGANHWRRARRVVRAATPADDPLVLAVFDVLRDRLGAPRVELRASPTMSRHRRWWECCAPSCCSPPGCPIASPATSSPCLRQSATSRVVVPKSASGR